MSDRFFTDSTFVDDQITLADDQAHHLINVMRAKLGDEVVVFDAQGNEHQTQIAELTKKRLTLRRTATTRPDRKLSTDITIAAALPKGDRQKFLIEKLVELGVAKFIPLSTPRGVAQVNAKVLSRISKQIIEATKQCRRSYLMEISESKTISEVLNKFDVGKHRCYIAHPYDAKPVESAAAADGRIDSSAGPKATSKKEACSGTSGKSAQNSAQVKDCVWLIGPEGGFTDEEVAQAVAAGWQAVSFGEIILRVETAAMMAAMMAAMTSGKRA